MYFNTYDYTVSVGHIDSLLCDESHRLHRYKTSQHAEEPFITIGAIASIFYFGWYLVIVPVVGIVENTLSDLDVPTADATAATAPATTAPSMQQ
jgi:hypothetical protein